MPSNAQELIGTAPPPAVYPGVMIFLTVIARNPSGDGLQRRLERYWRRIAIRPGAGGEVAAS